MTVETTSFVTSGVGPHGLPAPDSSVPGVPGEGRVR